MEKRNDGKYGVIFFGTCETANVQPTDIWPYDMPNTTKFCSEKNLARPLFMEGMEQMKQALAKDDSKGENLVHSKDQEEADMVKVGRREFKEAADEFLGSSKGLKRKLMGPEAGETGREKRTRRMTSKMLESLLMKDKKGVVSVEPEPEKREARLRQIECDWVEEDVEVTFPKIEKTAKLVKLGESALSRFGSEERKSEEGSHSSDGEKESGHEAIKVLIPRCKNVVSLQQIHYGNVIKDSRDTSICNCHYSLE